MKTTTTHRHDRIAALDGAGVALRLRRDLRKRRRIGPCSDNIAGLRSTWAAVKAVNATIAMSEEETRRNIVLARLVLGKLKKLGPNREVFILLWLQERH